MVFVLNSWFRSPPRSSLILSPFLRFASGYEWELKGSLGGGAGLGAPPNSRPLCSLLALIPYESMSVKALLLRREGWAVFHGHVGWLGFAGWGVREAGAGLEFGAGIGRGQFRQQSGELLPALGPSPGSSLARMCLVAQPQREETGAFESLVCKRRPCACLPPAPTLLGAESWPALHTACFSSPPVSVSVSRFHCF